MYVVYKIGKRDVYILSIKYIYIYIQISTKTQKNTLRYNYTDQPFNP
jgi:hypothetical protein